MIPGESTAWARHVLPIQCSAMPRWFRGFQHPLFYKANTMKTIKTLLSAAFVSLCLYAGAASADATHPVQFAKGTSASVVKGVVKGSSNEDYVLRAAGGQTMSVKLSAKSTLVYFNVLKKGAAEAMFVGSSEGKNNWSGSLPEGGDYIVRVYTMGKGKEPGHTTPFSLNISIK